MLTKAELEERRQLAAFCEEDAPLRHPLPVSVPLKPLAVFGMVAGAVAVLAVVACGGSPESLDIEGVGEVEGPVAVYGKQEAVEPTDDASKARYSAFAIDLETGQSWNIWETTAELAAIQVAGDRLVVWYAENLTIHSVSLDGKSEVVLHSGGALVPYPSPDGSKIAFSVGTPSDEPDSIIVLDVQSGGELLRIKADDPRIDAPESEEDWALEVGRWSMDGASLSAWGWEAGSFILTLDGEVHEIPDEWDILGRLSPNLRYGIDAPRLFSSGARSLTVVELVTGRESLTLTPEEGRVIFAWYWGAPASGTAMYGTVPPGAVNERPVRQAVWRIVDLDTGGTTVVSLDDEELRAEWDWLWRLQDAHFKDSPWGRCLHRHQKLDPCIDLFRAADEALLSLYGEPTTTQERQERSDSIRSTDIAGFVWLD